MFLSSIISYSCNEYTPKPSAYQRIDRAEIEYLKFENKDFSFTYPSDAQIKKQMAEKNNEFWFNLQYPQYGAIIYCSYLSVKKENINKVLDDSYQLAYSHASKANGISQSQFTNQENHTSGIIYDIDGKVAVPIQFYVTDGVSNFLRGSLYFNNVVDQDSVAPIIHFLRNDIVHIMETVEWKNQIK